jgi:uncharacterized protein YecT (DUF1311 family)
MKKLLLATCFSLTFLFTYSQIPDTTSVVSASDGQWITTELTECLKPNNLTIVEQNQCLYDALDKWELQLVATYEVVLSQIDEPAKSALKSSQNSWNGYKNNHFKFLEQHWGNMQGSSYKQVMIHEKIAFIKERNSLLFSLAQD